MSFVRKRWQTSDLCQHCKTKRANACNDAFVLRTLALLYRSRQVLYCIVVDTARPKCRRRRWRMTAKQNETRPPMGWERGGILFELETRGLPCNCHLPAVTRAQIITSSRNDQNPRRCNIRLTFVPTVMKKPNPTRPESRPKQARSVKIPYPSHL